MMGQWNKLAREVVDASSVNIHVEWVFEQPGLVEGVFSHGRSAGTG